MALGHWLKDYIGPHSGGSGGSGGGTDNLLVVNNNDGTLDRTWNEINNAYISGKTVKVRKRGLGGRVFVYDICAPNQSDGEYSIYTYSVAANAEAQMVEINFEAGYFTDAEDGYPTMSDKPPIG